MEYGKPLIATTVAAGVTLMAVPVAPAATAAPVQNTPAVRSAAPDAAGGLTPASTKRKSFVCKSPKKAKLNISWNPGHVSVTVYDNNHCKQKRVLKLVFKQATDVCLTVKAKTKGHRKVYTTGGTLQTITSPAKDDCIL